MRRPRLLFQVICGDFIERAAGRAVLEDLKHFLAVVARL